MAVTLQQCMYGVPHYVGNLRCHFDFDKSTRFFINSTNLSMNHINICDSVLNCNKRDKNESWDFEV